MRNVGFPYTFLATHETRSKVGRRNFAFWVGPKTGSRQTQERGNLRPLAAEGQEKRRVGFPHTFWPPAKHEEKVFAPPG